MRLRPFVHLLLLSYLICPLRAETTSLPYVAQVFTDHMVLQRDQADPIWGWTNPGETLTVTLGGTTAKATAGADGKWIAKITPPPAGGPYKLTVSGSQTVTFKDVLVGDVWFLSGQSNMQFGIGMVPNAEKEIATANQPNIRLFLASTGKRTAFQPVKTIEGHWQPCTPETIVQGGWNGFSGVGYFFARDLQPNIHVPIGLIECALGSTPGEAWVGRESLEKYLPDYQPTLDGLAEVEKLVEAGTYDKDKLQDEWYAKVGIHVEVSTPLFDAGAWKTMRNLPRNWGGSEEPDLNGYEGAVWIRKEIDLPIDPADKPAVLSLGGTDDGDATFVNGMRVGTGNGGGPRTYKVPAGTLKRGRNVVAICIFNTGGGAGLVGKPELLSLTVEGSPAISLAGDWKYQPIARMTELPPRLDTMAGNQQMPTLVFNYLVAPVIPYGIKGALWYQGEANVGRAYQYRKLLPALITDWRVRWHQGDFPFLVVQLPNYGGDPKRIGESDWAEFREAQALAAQNLPKVGLVATLDVGDPGDLHPANKQDVGRRLALLARGTVYQEKIPYSGPTYQSIKLEGGAVRVFFDHAEGLRAKGSPDLKGFAIAGEDHIFHWAEAKIDQNSVVLTSPQVATPVAVRYGWATNPAGNLINAAELPAFPFRNDDFPMITRNRK